MKTPRFIQIHQSNSNEVQRELLQGMSKPEAEISPKFLYDALGSKLFEAITCLPEYYPTRTEASIFLAAQSKLAALLPQGAAFIDLGAGNCEKAARLFEAFRPARYVAVDISVDFLRSAIECLQRQFPELDMAAVGLDFSASLALPAELNLPDQIPKVLFYPGSSIGNFTPDAALQFLKQAHQACLPACGGGLLIGVDLVKSTAVLEAAYDDALGVTAAFNRNLLVHANAIAGTNFDVAGWQHVALYNQALSRIEMHLQAMRRTQVSWAGGSRRFEEGERIHTENSYKWTVPQFAELLQTAGFAAPEVFTDPEHRFAVMWARAS